MDILNIDALSRGNSGNLHHGVLSIESLQTNLTIDPTKPVIARDHIRFDPHDIIEKQHDVEKRIQDTYEDITDLCFERIQQANILNRLDLFFDVPDTLYGNPILDMTGCIDHVIKKIRKNYMDAKRVGFRTIFITWINIRENNKNATKSKRKKNK